MPVAGLGMEEGQAMPQTRQSSCLCQQLRPGPGGSTMGLTHYSILSHSFVPRTS